MYLVCKYVMSTPHLSPIRFNPNNRLVPAHSPSSSKIKSIIMVIMTMVTTMMIMVMTMTTGINVLMNTKVDDSDCFLLTSTSKLLLVLSTISS